MKKIIILSIILAIIISVWVGIIYLNRVFIPQKLRPLIAEKVSSQIQRKFEFGRIHYTLFKGFIIDNIRIFDESPNADKVFLNIESAHFSILFLPLLKSKNIIIPAIYIDSPSANIKYKPDKTFNIPLLETRPTEEKKKFNIVISRIVLRNGIFSIEDQTKQPYFKREITQLNTKLSLSLPLDIKISLQGYIINGDKSNSFVFLKANYNLKDKSFNAQSRLTDIPLNEYKPYLINLPVAVAAADIKELEILSSKAADSIDCQFSSKAEKVALIKDNFKFSGSLSTKGNLKINLANKEINYDGLFDLTASEIEGIPIIKKVEEINGRISFSRDFLKTEKLSAKGLSYPFEISGELKNFHNPQVDFVLNGPDLVLKTSFAVLGKNVSIAYLDAIFLNSKCNLKGSLNIAEIKTPYVNLEGTLELALKDIKEICSRFGRNLNLPDLGGIIDSTFVINGPFGAGMQNLNISLDAESNEILVRGLRLTELVLSYIQNQSQGKAKLSSRAYKGNLNLTTKLNLFDNNIDYVADLNLKDLDLADLKKDTPFKDKTTSGKLFAQASLNGKTKDLYGMNGDAQLKISDGNLWELNLLRGLGELLGLTALNNIVFKEASGDFTIQDGKAYTNNLKFISDRLQLAFEGNFNFKGDLNFDVLVSFSEELQKEAKNLEQLISSIFTQAQKYISIKITGTFKKPNYKIVPRVVKDVVEGLFDIFKIPQE